MTTLSSDEVRIPRRAREAVARHERVVILNRERPVLALVHPEDVDRPPLARGRRLREIKAELMVIPAADAAFADDMQAIIESVGETPGGPWEQF